MHETFPQLIPIFPLYGNILLPKTILPLRIFEPRYLQMLEHSLENDKVIGMIQPQSSDEDRIFSIGCLGSIEHYQKQQNGNFLIRLQGEIRFKVKRELAVETLFRQVEVDYTGFLNDSQETLKERSISSLVDAFKSYTTKKTLQVKWEKLKEIPIQNLINILCMNLEFSALEKQALLESSSLNERWDHLIALMEMAAPEEGNSTNHFIN